GDTLTRQMRTDGIERRGAVEGHEVHFAEIQNQCRIALGDLTNGVGEVLGIGCVHLAPHRHGGPGRRPGALRAAREGQRRRRYREAPTIGRPAADGCNSHCRTIYLRKVYDCWLRPPRWCTSRT